MTIVEVAVASAIGMIVIFSMVNLFYMKEKAMITNRDTGQMRDIRKYLRSHLSCAKTLSQAECQNGVDTIVKGISCRNSELLKAPDPNNANEYPLKMGDYSVRVRCGGSVGADRMVVEARKSASTTDTWKDISGSIPWACDRSNAPNTPATIIKPSLSAYTGCFVEEGKVKCYGSNYQGLLGIGQSNGGLIQYCPAEVIGLGSTVTKLASGIESQCALDSGIWKCWGKLGWAQSPTISSSPVTGALDEFNVFSGTIDKIVMGGTVSITSVCVLKSGDLYCSGYLPNGSGQSGRQAAQKINGIAKIKDVKFSSNTNDLRICALTVNDSLMCWGDDGVHGGGLNPGGVDSPGGVGSLATLDYNIQPYMRYYTPKQVEGLSSGVTDFCVAQEHACAVQNGRVKCWGFSGKGVLGDGVNYTAAPLSTTATGPVLVSGITGATAVACGISATCAIVNGGVQCWGATLDSGGLPINFTPTNIPLAGNNNVAIDFGNSTSHVCVQDQAGEVKCFGSLYPSSGLYDPNNPKRPGQGTGICPIPSPTPTPAGGAGYVPDC